MLCGTHITGPIEPFPPHIKFYPVPLCPFPHRLTNVKTSNFTNLTSLMDLIFFTYRARSFISIETYFW